jgi:hypothetical protein
VLAVAGEGLVGLRADLVPGPRQRDVHDLGHHAGRAGQHRHPVREVDRLVDVVGDEHDRHAEPLAHPQDEVLELEPGLRVHRGERLVHQQQIGLVGEGARDRDPLLHPAGQLPRVLSAHVGEPDRGQRLADPGGARRAPDAPHLQRQLHVPGHGQPRVQRPAVVLEDHADSGRHGPQRHPLEQRLPRRRRHQPGQAAQQRRLAGSAGPHHAQELAARDVERDVRKRHPRPGAAVHLAHLTERYNWRGDHRAPSTARAP